LVTLELARPTVLGALWDVITTSNWSILDPVFREGRVWVFIESEVRADCKVRLDKLVVDGFLKSYEIADQWIPLSVVGEGLTQDQSIFYRVYDVLMREQVPVILGTSTSTAVSFGVHKNHLEEALRALHKEFLE